MHLDRWEYEWVNEGETARVLSDVANFHEATIELLSFVHRWWRREECFQRQKSNWKKSLLSDMDADRFFFFFFHNFVSRAVDVDCGCFVIRYQLPRICCYVHFNFILCFYLLFEFNVVFLAASSLRSDSSSPSSAFFLHICDNCVVCCRLRSFARRFSCRALAWRGFSFRNAILKIYGAQRGFLQVIHK